MQHAINIISCYDVRPFGRIQHWAVEARGSRVQDWQTAMKTLFILTFTHIWNSMRSQSSSSIG